jgi:hypothetical protein
MTTTTSKPTRVAQRKPLRSWPSALLFLLLASAAGEACQARALGGTEGSQTHFLRSCSTECEDGLDCVCGVCTRPCELDLDCAELDAGATCSLGEGVCPGAAPSCTVECSVDADCSNVAGDMACVAGHCQGPALPARLSQSGGGPSAVGEPCITGDERFATFSNFSLGEVNIEGPGGACGPVLMCIVNHFQGRVSCPAGHAADELGTCLTPQGEPISVPVEPQLESRPAERHVICSCRSDGPERGADYCSCPSGMQCEELLRPRSNGDDAYAGSYCTYPTAAEPSSEPSEGAGSL